MVSSNNRSVKSSGIFFIKFSLFMANEISLWYQLGQSLSSLRSLVGSFQCYSNFARTFCKQTLEAFIRRHILWCLIGVSTVCLCPTRITLGLHALNIFPAYQIIYIYDLYNSETGRGIENYV